MQTGPLAPGQHTAGPQPIPAQRVGRQGTPPQRLLDPPPAPPAPPVAAPPDPDAPPDDPVVLPVFVVPLQPTTNAAVIPSNAHFAIVRSSRHRYGEHDHGAPGEGHVQVVSVWLPGVAAY